MAVLKNNEFKSTVWNSKNTFITGLDPLGLQITSESSYVHLLSGITNLTNRIRYYGFYCWLLEYYALNIRDTEPKKQYDFIRKAELMLAVVMKSNIPEYSQVTGSNFAMELIHKAPSDFFDLTTNAVKTGDNRTYWKFSSGAFGQYYAGAMHEIGLTLRSDNGNFICTNKTHYQNISGAEVADVFKENVDRKAREKFVKNIIGGELPVHHIEELYEAFALNKITYGGSEWKIYCDLLLQYDHPMQEITEDEQLTYHRKNTMRYVLESIQSSDELYSWSHFTNEIYFNKGVLNEESDETLKTWYFYNFNELWHFGAGSVFWGMLHFLGTEYHQVHLPLFINQFSNEILTYLEDKFDMIKGNKLIEEIKKIPNIESNASEEINNSIRNGDYKSAAGIGLSLIFSIFNTNIVNIDEIHKEAFAKGLVRDGNVLEMMFQIRDFEGSLDDFIQDFILRNIIYRHQFVALRKTGSGVTSTLKFLLDENYIRQIESFTPRFTSPRLGALLNILKDLSLIDDQLKITDAGINFLNTNYYANN